LQLATTAPASEICSVGSCFERTSSGGPRGWTAPALVGSPYAWVDREFAVTNSDPPEVDTPATVDRFTASGSIGESRSVDVASAGRYRTRLDAFWSEVTESSTPGRGGGACDGTGGVELVHEAATMPRRQASNRDARLGAMVRDDDTALSEHGSGRCGRFLDFLPSAAGG
jgi:hypothetical protein